MSTNDRERADPQCMTYIGIGLTMITTRGQHDTPTCREVCPPNRRTSSVVITAHLVKRQQIFMSLLVGLIFLPCIYLSRPGWRGWTFQLENVR